MKKTSISLGILSLACFFFNCALLPAFCRASGAGTMPGSSEDDSEKLGVMAVIGHGDDSMVFSSAIAIHRALTSMPKIKVMDALEEKDELGLDRLNECDSDLDRLNGIYQQGYLQAYSFEYKKAIEILDRVLDGLEQERISPGRWDLWEKTMIMKGVALSGLKKEDAAVHCFLSILKTRPEMVLSKKNYSPKTIDLWSKARKIIMSSPKGKLVIETSPPDAIVQLDGKSMGKTPLILEVPIGGYHLHIRHAQAGAISRSVTVSAITKRIRVQLDFEGAVDLCDSFPGIRLKAESPKLKPNWWPWLAARLHIRKMVTVQIRKTGKNSRLVAALVDLERGEIIREGWFELGREAKANAFRDSVDLARFLVTGQAADRMGARFQIGLEGQQSRDNIDKTNGPGFIARPWYRTWWTYGIAGGAILVASISSHLVSDYYSRQAKLSTNIQSRDLADKRSETWLWIGIGGYALSAAVIATGLIMHFTFDDSPQEDKPSIGIGASIQPSGAFVGITGMF